MSSELRVDTIKLANGNSATASGLGIGGIGKIGQVIQTNKVDTFSSSSTSFTDVTGLTASITPTATSSKILVNLRISYSMGDAHNTGMMLRLLRGSTVISGGTAASSRPSALMRYNYATAGNGYYSLFYSTGDVSTNFLDSPNSTDSQVYKIQGIVNGSNSLHINRTGTDSDSANYPRTNSTITLMEVLA
tara:strand:+ start:1094 stop:1663 length:570 start_codon:yes stop_codon:yes gene_type:complete